MPDDTDPIQIKVLTAIDDVAAEAWDACAGADNPFLSHAFLSALEASGSVRAETGWLPQHLLAEDAAGRVAACTPLYLKDNSYGEYVFDWGWAEAFERAGGRYYPKLISAVPFTPVTGRRLLVRPDADPALADALAIGMIQLAERYGASSVHVNFPPEDQWRRLANLSFLQRIGQQFHWRNRGYATFDDFLADLTSRKRKTIRRERKAVADQGIQIRTLVGDDIQDRHWDAFFQFNRDTTDRKWGQRYLTRTFFSLLPQVLGDRVVLVVAEADGRLVGGALNLRGTDTLYGRYWGCVEDYAFLHFEACYYRAIDHAIETGLTWVEAGAQGPHKIQRGYMPRPTYSAHWIANEGFRDAVERYLEGEREAMGKEMRLLAERSPFRKDGEDSLFGDHRA